MYRYDRTRRAVDTEMTYSSHCSTGTAEPDGRSLAAGQKQVRVVVVELHAPVMLAVPLVTAARG